MKKKIKWQFETILEKITNKEIKNNFKIELGENIVYTNQEKKYSGLQKDYFFEINGKKVYVFDNHNKAIFPIFENYQNQKISIIHIDAHRDDSKVRFEIKEKVNSQNLENFYHKTRISDYLDFLEKTKLTNKIYRYTQSWEFDNFKLPKENFVLNLDIDIFGFDGQVVDLEIKIKTILEAWKKADMVLIASSPGFIDQNEAKFLIESFLNIW